MNTRQIAVAAAIPPVRVADVEYNAEQIVAMIGRAAESGAEVVCLPELCITGASCQDLFNSTLLLDKASEALESIIDRTAHLDIVSVVGLPIAPEDGVESGVAVFSRGELLAVSSEGTARFETLSGAAACVVVGEDVQTGDHPDDIDIIFNPSSAVEMAGSYSHLNGRVAELSRQIKGMYVYVSSGFGESTQDGVYAGNALIYDNGRAVAVSERFSIEPQMVLSEPTAGGGGESQEGRVNRRTAAEGMVRSEGFDSTLKRLVFVPYSNRLPERCDEILNIQTLGLVKRLVHTHCSKVVIGISGGLDSTLALLVCVLAFDRLGLDRRGIIGVTMPGFGTTGRTRDNAVTLMESLGVTSMEISIVDSVLQHFKDIRHDPSVHDVTYENSQARERTQLLMDLSNKFGGMVVGTGDLSELALGWCTYNGDHMSMYAVNAGVPKTLIPHLVRHFAASCGNGTVSATLHDVIDTPISPELIPAAADGTIRQKTEDLVGPYELHDFFLYHFVRRGAAPAEIFDLACRTFSADNVEQGGQSSSVYDAATVKHWLTTFFRRFFNQQFKRSCMPDGPCVGSVSLSPRGAWHMPSDACSTLWLRECENL